MYAFGGKPYINRCNITDINWITLSPVVPDLISARCWSGSLFPHCQFVLINSDPTSGNTVIQRRLFQNCNCVLFNYF